MTTGSHEQVLKLSTENTVICKGLPKGSGMCEHQEGQRGPVTGGPSGPSPFVSQVEIEGMAVEVGILTFLPTHYSAMFPSSFKKSLPLHTTGSSGAPTSHFP